MSLFKKIKRYRFEIRHLIIIFAAMAIFQTILSYINNTSTNSLLSKTLEFYKKYSAENLADLTTTSLELLIEHELQSERTEKTKKLTIQEINIILTQQSLRQHVEEVKLILQRERSTFVFDEGSQLYSFFFEKQNPVQNAQQNGFAVEFLNNNHEEVIKRERIVSELDEDHAFHVLVPFVPMGEISGALYMKILPDFSNIAYEISSVYNETGAIFSALIILSLLAVFFVTSYTLRERDLAQEQLLIERQEKIRREIEHEKEAVFTRRIYHAHHKAEKIMGYIKEDLRAMNTGNFQILKDRIIKYANFIARVIYDMKSYEQRVEVVRNPIFNTQINDTIRFIVENVFKRIFRKGQEPRFVLDLDPNMATVSINEYVIWEIIEPLIQNAIDHNSNDDIQITIKTIQEKDRARVIIEDNGSGIKEELLEENEQGIKKLFLEQTSTKDPSENSGYGCYIVYEICTRRCGWKLDAVNIENGGARFVITIL
ncbi:MAG: ATP-binding protein [Calditrichaeota bacterium]|nr:ATP-binding protein [Calditrichota bacterium]